MNESDIVAQHPLPSDPAWFSQVPAGQNLTLGRMAEILRATGASVSIPHPIEQPAERVSDAAVEAAEAVLVKWGMTSGQRTAARLALEAALPHLTPVVASEGEAVAWRWRATGASEWQITQDRTGAYYYANRVADDRGGTCEVRPLFLHPAPQGAVEALRRARERPAREAAQDAFEKHFNGTPSSRELIGYVIDAYFAALTPEVGK